MSRWDKVFLVVQRLSSVLVIVFAAFVLAMMAWQWFEWGAYQREMTGDQPAGAGYQRTLPYSGEEIETADGALIAIYQEGENAGERIELGGITVVNPSTGKTIELATGPDEGVVQFELIFDQGDGGKAVGYLATTATAAQHAQGRMDLLVGALPAMSRNVVARNIRFSDLPRMRGDASVGLLMWPEEGEAYLVAIRLDDGAIIESANVKLPTLKENALSQGPGGGNFAAADAAPVSRFSEW